MTKTNWMNSDFNSRIVGCGCLSLIYTIETNILRFPLVENYKIWYNQITPKDR